MRFELTTPTSTAAIQTRLANPGKCGPAVSLPVLGDAVADPRRAFSTENSLPW